MARILEHDKDGNLLWFEAAVSTPRQAGKGHGLIRPLCEWRMNAHDLFGEPQTVLHISAQLNTVMEIAAPSMAHHRDLGSKVRLTNGEQSIQIEDGSRWLMRSTTGAYGFSVSMPVVDEIWAVLPRVIDSMVTPTMIERAQPQLVMTSTANAQCTSTYPMFAASAGEADDRLLLEWSAPPEAAKDMGNRAWWKAAAPHWSAQRERMMARQLEKAGRADFLSNWLNIWPEITKDAKTPPPFPNFASMPVVEGEPPSRCEVIALDEDRYGDGAGVVWFSDGRIWFKTYASVSDALAHIEPPDRLIAGLSLRGDLAKAGLQGNLFGMKELRLGMPALLDAVRTKAFAHDHSDGLVAAFNGAVLRDNDSGLTISTTNSSASVLPVKLIAWVLWSERQNADERPMIWA